jgi:RNA polymerase sigma-54 factor
MMQELALVPRFGLEVSPALVSFGELLMLPYPAMQSVIEDELSRNVALERIDAGECPVCAGAWRTRCPVCDAPTRGSSGRGVGPFVTAADSPAAESDAEALLRAVRLEMGGADSRTVEYVVGSLDRHGLLDRSCEQLAAELEVEVSAVARVVDIIKEVGPPGVGATSIAECLLLQLDALGMEGDNVNVARAVIRDHLGALARGRLLSIAAALSVSRGQVRQALDLIRQRLRPYPAFDGNAITVSSYVIPDAVIRANDDIPGEFMVELVEPALTRFAVRRASPGRTASESAVRARSFVGQLRDRWETLRRVIECAVARQKEFLLNGPPALVPLTRAEVAAELNMHESTVSRAVADKYVLLPDRTLLPLCRFFTASGGVDGELRRLLEAASGPVSDQRLAELLGEAGFTIARRTVAKHRARLGITTASLR